MITKTSRRLRPLRALPWLALASLGFAAGIGCEPGTQDVDHENEGQACISGEEGQPHRIDVDFGLCLSSSCDELLDASCMATVDGSTITIEALATVRSQTGPNLSCTADCGLVMADCEIPPLAAGTYTVVYGDESTELTVPSDEPACAGS